MDLSKCSDVLTLLALKIELHGLLCLDFWIIFAKEMVLLIANYCTYIMNRGGLWLTFHFARNSTIVQILRRNNDIDKTNAFHR